MIFRTFDFSRRWLYLSSSSFTGTKLKTWPLLPVDSYTRVITFIRGWLLLSILLLWWRISIPVFRTTRTLNTYTTVSLIHQFNPLLWNFSSIFHLVCIGTAFTVLWENVSLQDQPNSGNFTFEVTLKSNGDIIFVYQHIPNITADLTDHFHPVKIGLSDAYIMDRTIFCKHLTPSTFISLFLSSFVIFDSLIGWFSAQLFEEKPYSNTIEYNSTKKIWKMEPSFI